MGASALGLLLAGSVAAEPTGVDFELAIQDEAFVLRIEMVFKAGRTLDEVRQAFKDPTLLPRLSPLLTRVVQRGPDTDYELHATATRFFISQTSVSRCEDTGANDSWRQDCRHALDLGDTARYFRSGRSSIQCSAGDDSGQVSCLLRTQGEPRRLGIGFITARTPQDLALSGAARALRDYGPLLLYVNQRTSPEAARNAFRRSPLDRLAGRLRSQARRVIDAGELTGGQTLLVRGSDRQRRPSFELSVQ